MSGIFYIVIWSDSFWLFREIVDNKMGRREGGGQNMEIQVKK